MLSPSNRIVLLPQDREIMDITGMSEEEYRWFVRECYKNTKLRPGEPVALEPFTISLILTAVSILLSAAAMLLTPKPKDQETKTPEEETIEGQNVVRRDRFAPKSGFDSFQNVVDMGSVVPIIYCKREEIDGITYGGLRVNTNLLWSQVLSVGGGQFFKGLFLVGEAGVEIDYQQIALGNNTLASYELTEDAEAGRISLYYTNDGGRITTTDDYKLGVTPDKDPGAIAGDGSDVYSVVDTTNFCQALQPSNQLEFGVYNLLGNNFGYKIGEDFEPMSQWQLGDDEYQRQEDNERYALREKQAQTFSTRAGITEIRKNGSLTNPIRHNSAGVTENLYSNVEINDEIIYNIYSSSQQDYEFTKDGAGGGGQPEAVLDNRDVANTIASIQRGYDESIAVGDLFKIGTVLTVCIERSEDPFISEVEVSDGNGTDAQFIFKVIKIDDPEGTGRVHIWDANGDLQRPEPDINGRGRLATTHSHLLKTTTASFSIERACSTIEVGFKSVLNVRTSNIVHFNSLVTEENYDSNNENYYRNNSYQAYVDASFCGGLEDGETSDDTYRQTIIPGRYTASDSRYSFFRIEYKDINETDFTLMGGVYGFRSQAGAEVYNFIRFEFLEERRREFRFVPVSSYEVRNVLTDETLYVIDYKVQNRDANGDPQLLTVSRDDTRSDCRLKFYGQAVANTIGVFSIPAFINPESSTKRGGEIVRATRQPGPTDLVPDGVYALVGGSGRKARVATSQGPDGAPNFSFTIRKGGVGYEVGDIVRTRVSDSVQELTFEVEEVSPAEPERAGVPLGFADEDDAPSYVDAYARVAEAFVYSEVSSSATQPEHGISYINLISENPAFTNSPEGPQYDSMSIVGLNIRSSFELSTLDQLSVYCTRGVIDFHLFPDVFEDLLTNPNYGTGQFFDAAQIDTASFQAAADWTYDRRYFFDGAISEKINLRSWGAERARDFLLDLSISGGKFTLNPAIRFDEPEPVVAMFSSGNILEDSLQVNYFDSQDRLDPIVTVRWREERRDSSVDSKGLFPQIREFSVRRSGVDDDAPVIQVDLSNFCTNRKHAEDRAKLECQSKRYITHAVSFKTVPSQTGVQAGSIIKLGIETVYYNQPQNGAISNTGEVTAWPPLNDGSYPVILWDGNQLSETTLVVVNGKATNNANSVFCTQDSRKKAETYKVSSVSFDEDGNVDIEALYWPTGDDGISLLTLNWEDKPGVPSIWEIDG